MLKRFSFVFKAPLILLVCALLVHHRKLDSKNNVCKTFSDYYGDRDSNENCYYNPDYKLRTPEIVKRHGYPVEEHEVTTEDGYILKLFRIPPAKDKRNLSSRPVFLQHGYATNSEIFVLTGRKSLAFILADRGYDVWLGNSRGTRYSSRHTNATIAPEAYWNFTFDELGLYDLPASLDHVTGLTGLRATYVGLSLGTLTMYVYALTYPEEARQRVDVFVNLAPSAFLSEYGTSLRLTFEYWDYIEAALRTLSKTVPQWGGALGPIARHVCLPYPFQMRLCLLPLMALLGFNWGQHDPETLPLLLMQTPESPSLKIFTHGVQLARTGRIARFDYGKGGNPQVYAGASEPPAYNFTRMRVPTYLVRARNDKIVTKRNVEALYEALPKDVARYGIYEVEDEDFSHVDFVMGKDVVELCHDHVVGFLRRFHDVGD